MSGDSIFNEEDFLSTPLGGAFDTKYQVVPEGVYQASISAVKPSSGVTDKPGSKNDGKPWARIDVLWELEDDALKAKMEQETIIVYQGVMLQLTETDPPQLARGKGKNIPLGRLMEALKLNTGQNINFNQFVGRPGLVKVEQEIYNGEPKARVVSVASR